MEKFNYGIGTDNTVKVYDNQGAYNTLQEMMKRGKSSVSCPLKPSDSAPLKHSTMPP